MSNVRKYIDDARSEAHESFSNASGGFVDDMNFAGDDFFGAGGSGGGAPQSQPYIINVRNTTGTPVDVPNFAVLGSNEFLGTAGFDSNGNFTKDAVVVSSGISNVSYKEMLEQFRQSPFSVGLTYIQSTTDGQVLETLSVNTKDSNGNQAQKTLVPTIDPYQQQTNIIAMKVPYRVDGNTKVVISSVLAGAVLKLYFYPSDSINLSRGLSGRAVSERFGNPGITRG